MSLEPSNEFNRYHAHVYFDAGTTAQAKTLCSQAWHECHIGVGRLHEKLVGPHPRWSCQLSFDSDEFDHIIDWLNTHRGGLSILVHPLTGDALAEHTIHARWLGTPLELNTSIFQEHD